MVLGCFGIDCWVFQMFGMVWGLEKTGLDL